MEDFDLCSDCFANRESLSSCGPGHTFFPIAGQGYDPEASGGQGTRVEEYGYWGFFKTEEDHRARFDEVKAKHVAQWKALSSPPLTLSQTYHGQVYQAKLKEATERVFVARGEYLSLGLQGVRLLW